MSRVKQTRRERNQQVDRFQLYKPFIFYIAVLAVMQFAVVKSDASSLTAAAGLFVAGLMTWGLYEYATHRWVLHREPKTEGFNLPGNLTHLRHHADPNSLQRLNVQLSESVPVCVVYYLLAWGLTGSWQAATHLFTGLIAGYFFYEYLDFQAHHGTSRGRLTRYFRKYHLQHHHYDATVRYGVTSPLFDYLFGTFHIEKRSVAGKVQAAETGRGIS
ncbi:MAG: dihydroceramide fatty acyl 2-hydroxylase [Acidobacteriota bacterium]|jgi:sterol desaturase/sphingolipid hydroxylase (fatty acid hydroxylase superfamily)|nr:dihydroceramide fatty acyl 2-hydroxylase [Acidobacteriota bacterium]